MPAWLVTRVARVVTGLSERTEVTVASAVITSPGRTGARKRQATSRKTLPGPGSCSATERVEQARGHAALDDDRAEPARRGELGVVVDRVAVAGDLGEERDVALGHGAGSSGRRRRSLWCPCRKPRGDAFPRPSPASRHLTRTGRNEEGGERTVVGLST